VCANPVEKQEKERDRESKTDRNKDRSIDVASKLYYFVRNNPVALLESLCARNNFVRFVNIGVFDIVFVCVCVQSLCL